MYYAPDKYSEIGNVNVVVVIVGQTHCPTVLWLVGALRLAGRSLPDMYYAPDKYSDLG